jgi:hypothetical protein
MGRACSWEVASQLLLRLLVFGGSVDGGGTVGARRREISDLQGRGRRRNASRSLDASSHGRAMHDVAGGGSNSGGLWRPPGQGKEQEAGERVVQGGRRCSHSDGLSSGRRSCMIGWRGRRGGRRHGEDGPMENVMPLSDLLADCRTRRATWWGRRPVIRPSPHAPPPGMGRRRSADRLTGVSGGGGTVALLEGDALPFSFFLFFFQFYYLIRLTKGPMSMSAGVLVLNANSALTGGPVMSDLVSIYRKSLISANYNKLQKISRFCMI